MDPNANLTAQRATARNIIELRDDLDRNPDEVADRQESLQDFAVELAELVQALDEWRTKGGYDPYSHRGQKAYQEALTVARSLVDEPTVDAPARREYMRGMVELIADLYAYPPDKKYHSERKHEIALDLGWPPEMVA